MTKRINTIRARFIAALVLSTLLQACGTASRAPELSERQKTAQAMLEERCKRAGVRIHRTVNDVEGVFLLKVRPSEVNYGDQFRLDDPFGHDFGGMAYVRSFLRGHYEANTRRSDGAPLTNSLLGFSHVEAIDPADGKRYRYSGATREVTHVRSVLVGGDGRTTFKTIDFVADATPITGPAPRYGVTYDDISSREEREYWIAGSSLKIIDLQTNEVIAERIGYMRDPGMGNTSGGRSPWLFALDTACPSFVVGRSNSRPAAAATDYQASRFVQQVLKPKEEK